MMTIYSQLAGRYRLDALADRTLRFAQAVVEGMTCFSSADALLLKRLMLESAQMLLVGAVGDGSRFFSRSYASALEQRSPFSYRALARARRRFQRQSPALMRLIEAFVTPAKEAL
jgi:hypothetical protein